jgi:hypothetical protein
MCPMLNTQAMHCMYLMSYQAANACLQFGSLRHVACPVLSVTHVCTLTYYACAYKCVRDQSDQGV